MITKNDLGISTASLYPMHTEEALQTLLEMGFRVFEVFVNAQQEFSPDFMKELKKRADHYGAIFTSVHPYTSPMETMLLFGNYDRRTEEGIEIYKSFMEAAAHLGAKYVVIHGVHGRHAGSHVPNKSGFNAIAADKGYWETFSRLYRAGRDIGAYPIQENVTAHKSESPDFIRSMKDYLQEDCAFVMDIKQCRLSGVPIEEMVKAMGEKLCHVHISDSKGDFPCLVPGIGDYDFGKLFALLNDIGYTGKLVTEVYSNSYDDIQVLAESRQKMLQFV
ncbi:sugar phosphate isomerase/epimerase family protein [Scatolibacter rhodanostii]|uniref:sugar phosphate isomerase/epimerase family protein n=1 Tax=Scatolibacter rhodanostii TaxID=2014781 RepID=UPI0013565824|nr:sugar phosphate isomerase/epimerase [Scatolibacter rhodanostii]